MNVRPGPVSKWSAGHGHGISLLDSHAIRNPTVQRMETVSYYNLPSFFFYFETKDTVSDSFVFE
jgi:hypothetical protein